MLAKGDKKIIIGYDLANTCSQISYGYLKEDCDVATVGTVEGEENYDIPTVLCKRVGTNQWLFGYDAIRFHREKPEESILVDNLLQSALDGETIQIDGKGYHPATLLALFVKRSLSTVTARGNEGRITAMMFTAQTADRRMKELIQRIEKTLDLKNAEIFSQCYEESFFNYLTYQKKVLWNEGALLLDYRGEDLTSVYMGQNNNTVPKVMYSEKRRFAFAGTDREFCNIAAEICADVSIMSVYLIGEKFGGDWMKDSLRYLCDGRRVFQGNNLYSKGACYALLKQFGRQSQEQQDQVDEYIFLSPEVLKANVGMKVQKRGEEAYNALLDAGMEWVTLDETFEFYLQGEGQLELLITPVVKCPSKQIGMELDSLHLEESQVTRIRMKLRMPRENVLEITVSDLGFGEFRQGSDKSWVQEVELY